MCIFSRNTPEVLKFWTSCLPYNHGKWNHPLDTLLYITPLIPCNEKEFRLLWDQGLFCKCNTLWTQYTVKPTYLKLFALIQRKRNDTRQKQQEYHRKILSSQHPEHRDLKAMGKKRTLKQVPKYTLPAQSRGTDNNTEVKSHLPLQSVWRSAEDTVARALHKHHLDMRPACIHSARTQWSEDLTANLGPKENREKIPIILKREKKKTKFLAFSKELKVSCHNAFKWRSPTQLHSH